MKKYQNKSPKEVMLLVTVEMIERACVLSKKKQRDIFVHKSASTGVNVLELNPATKQGRENLEKFLTPIKRHYTFSGLGSPEEKNAINWRHLNLPLWRRLLLAWQLIIVLFKRGMPGKNNYLRKMGVHLGKNTEIMQFAWLDHFRPELIFIGDNTLIGAFTKISVHAYEGGGKFTYALTEIGSNCIIGAGSSLGSIIIEDNVRILPNTNLSPYYARIRTGSVVGWDPPPLRKSNAEEIINE